MSTMSEKVLSHTSVWFKRLTAHFERRINYFTNRTLGQTWLSKCFSYLHKACHATSNKFTIVAFLLFLTVFWPYYFVMNLVFPKIFFIQMILGRFEGYNFFYKSRFPKSLYSNEFYRILDFSLFLTVLRDTISLKI